MTEVRRYTIMSSMGIVAREGFNTVVLGHGTDLVFASDYDALAARVQAVEEVNRIAAIKATVGDTEYSLRRQLAEAQVRITELEHEANWEGEQFRQFAQEILTPDMRVATEGPISFGKLKEVVEAAIAVPTRKLTQANQQVARLRNSIMWALGYCSFRPRKAGEGAYWWRKELRARAFPGGIAEQEIAEYQQHALRESGVGKGA